MTASWRGTTADSAPARLPPRALSGPYRHWPAQGTSDLRHCIAFGVRSNASIVYRFVTGADAPVSVIATSLYQALPESSSPELRAKIGSGRKLLSFAPYHTFGVYFNATPSQRARMWWGLVENMARVHKLDWKKLGFWAPVFIPNGLTKQQLIDSHRRIYRKFYLRPAIIMRYLIKFIINPSNIGAIIKAGFKVVKYSLDGYLKK